MTTETVEAKADRLFEDRRYQLSQTLPDGGTVWRVHGDNGSYDVTVDDDGPICTCPATGRCAHGLVAAAAAADRDQRPFTEGEGDPFDGLNDREDANASTNADGDRGPETVDVVTGEVVDDEEENESGPQPALATADPDTLDVTTAAMNMRTFAFLADTEFVTAKLRGRPAAVFAAVRYGAELGLGPMQAMSQIHILDGSPWLSAELQLRLYRQAGHRLEVSRADAEAVELVGTRGDTDEQMTISYTLEDAERSGLVDVDNGQPRARSKRGKPMPWETYTADMIWWRAVTRLVRRLAPDSLRVGE